MTRASICNPWQMFADSDCALDSPLIPKLANSVHTWESMCHSTTEGDAHCIASVRLLVSPQIATWAGSCCVDIAFTPNAWQQRISPVPAIVCLFNMGQDTNLRIYCGSIARLAPVRGHKAYTAPWGLLSAQRKCSLHKTVNGPACNCRVLSWRLHQHLINSVKQLYIR